MAKPQIGTDPVDGRKGPIQAISVLTPEVKAAAASRGTLPRYENDRAWYETRGGLEGDRQNEAKAKPHNFDVAHPFVARERKNTST